MSTHIVELETHVVKLGLEKGQVRGSVVRRVGFLAYRMFGMWESRHPAMLSDESHGDRKSTHAWSLLFVSRLL